MRIKKIHNEGELIAEPYSFNETEFDAPSLVIFGHLDEESFNVLNERMAVAGALPVYDRDGVRDGNYRGVGVFSLN